MDHGPLVNEEIAAGAELAGNFNRFAPVDVAFWLKASEVPQRYLYIVSELGHAGKRDVGYREVLRLSDEMGSPFMNPFRVKLVGSDDPLARAAVELNQRYGGRTAIRIGGEIFGGMSVDDVYIYPAPSALASTVPT